MKSVNWIHVLIALGLGALLLHLFRTKTSAGKRSGS